MATRTQTQNPAAAQTEAGNDVAQVRKGFVTLLAYIVSVMASNAKLFTVGGMLDVDGKPVALPGIFGLLKVAPVARKEWKAFKASILQEVGAVFKVDAATLDSYFSAARALYFSADADAQRIVTEYTNGDYRTSLDTAYRALLAKRAPSDSERSKATDAISVAEVCSTAAKLSPAEQLQAAENVLGALAERHPDLHGDIRAMLARISVKVPSKDVDGAALMARVTGTKDSKAAA